MNVSVSSATHLACELITALTNTRVQIQPQECKKWEKTQERRQEISVHLNFRETLKQNTL